MMKVIGYAALKEKGTTVPYSFERYDPQDYDVLIDIKYCGICHTDIHQVNNDWGGSKYPMVPGHEITGIVSATGPKVTRYKIGDKVGIGCYIDSCRNCDLCNKGLEQYCKKVNLTYNGIEKDGKTSTKGGYSNKIVVDEKYVLKMPNNISLDEASPLLCAGITLYSPLKYWKVGIGKKIAIIGFGGLGHIGVKLASKLGAEVTVLSHSVKKLEDAKKMGADNFFDTSDPEIFNKLEGYFDIIINTVSNNINLDKYLNLLVVNGTMVMVGLPKEDVKVNAHSLVGSRRNLAGSVNGGIAEIQEMLDFCDKNKIKCNIELIPIQKINEAYQKILDSNVRYRFVIDMKSLEY